MPFGSQKNRDNIIRYGFSANKSIIPARNLNGTYTGITFAARTVALIEEHDPAAAPLFIYLALHNTHAPVEAPPECVTSPHLSNLSFTRAFSVSIRWATHF